MSTPLHVVAAVLQDAQGRVLIAQRPEGKTHAGLWEFPGGKVEHGESALEALKRELREELGIEVLDAQPLICVPVAAVSPPPRIQLRLDTWHRLQTTGTPKALEHAALAWVAVDELASYPMPPADRPIVAALRGPDAVLITPIPDETPEAEAAFLGRIAALLQDGLRRVQLRLPRDRDAQRARLGLALATLCRESGAALHLHGHESADLAREWGCGLHLRASELHHADTPARVAECRASGRPVSAACHNAAELAQAEALGLDDVLLGPVLPTPSHPGEPALGWADFERLRATVSLPVFAIGGVGPQDLAEARRHGAQGVAGIRAFWGD
jgi:8-oxo-dGTP diphosphatase